MEVWGQYFTLLDILSKAVQGSDHQHGEDSDELRHGPNTDNQHDTVHQARESTEEVNGHTVSLWKTSSKAVETEG